MKRKKTAKYKLTIKKSERRKKQRLNIPLKVKYKWLAKKGILEEVFTRDISGGGMRIRVDKPFKKGGRLKALLYFPEEDKPINVITEVVWCKKRKFKKKNKFDVGIKHVKVAAQDKERFVFLFCETMMNFLMSALQPDKK